MIEEPILERGRCVCKCYLGVLVYSGYDTQFHHEHFFWFRKNIFIYIYTAVFIDHLFGWLFRYVDMAWRNVVFVAEMEW